MSRFQFPRMFSVESHKARLANDYGYLNAINYMSPHLSGGVGNLCAGASPGCIALCLGLYSGQAGMVRDLENGTNITRDSRKRKAQFFQADVQAFLLEMSRHLERLVTKADKLGLSLCVRPNGSTDIPFERIKLESTGLSIIAMFPGVQFVDYTKRPERFNYGKPENLSLTFSRSETNERQALALLRQGYNVAVVFENELPGEYLGVEVIDGDLHDLRHLDRRAPGGLVVGLKAKGRKAQADQSGFIVRGIA